MALMASSSNYSPFDNGSSNNGRSSTYHAAAVLEFGRSGFAVGKELKRQLTKYLNECRNRENDHGTESDSTTLKLKSSVKMKSPPPVPHPDYACTTGSITDGSEHSDEGWDTDFDDDMDEDRHKNEHQEETAAATSANHSNGIQGSLISSLINKLNTQSNNDNRRFKSPINPPHRSGSSSSISQSNFARDDRSEAEATLQSTASSPRRQMPRPPKDPVVLPKNTTRPQRSVRPLQNPPPPPPKQSPTSRTRNHEFVSDNYEVPTPALSEAGSTADMCRTSSRNSLSLSSRSTSPGKSEFLSQQDAEQEMLITDDELGMRKDYEMSDDCLWPSSSSTSIRSISSDVPELPPKNVASRHIPPPLPEKPRGTTTPSLSSKQSTSSDDVDRSQKRSAKVINLFSMMTNRRGPSDKKMNGAKERSEASDREFSSPQIPHMTKSSSMSSLTRPLPPVPNGTDRKHRSSAMLPMPPPLVLMRGESVHPLEIHPWFHKVERDVAEALLKDLGQSGSYLVRESRRAGESSPYTLTIFYDDKISHLNIRVRSDGKYALGKEKGNEKPFGSVEELILYHQLEPILLTARNQAIGKTILQQHPPKNTF